MKRIKSGVHKGRNIALQVRYDNPDPLAIEGVDHIEIYVGNAKQAAYYYSLAFGFTPIAYRGPETGFREAASYVLRQNQIHLVLTSPLQMTSDIAASLLRHGDTVHDIALAVPDCEAFYHEAMARGADSILPPKLFEDDNGTLKRAAIRTYGETIHSLVERKGYKGLFAPGYVAYKDLFLPLPIPEDNSVGLQKVDHIVGNVELGKMEFWVEFYEKVLGFKQMIHFTDKDISTEYSALMSKVLSDGKGKIKFPINEPAQGRRKSQIEEYLEYHHGAGVQHVAMQTMDVISTVSELRKRGVPFLRVPKTYYEEVPRRVGSIKEDMERIASLGILVDRDDDGYLLQLFTKPVQDRPTLFYEIIQREGSQGFGIGNFKALFEAIEREQALRGNL